MNPVVTCAVCGAKNRLKSPPEGQLPACGRCGETLPWLVAATDGSFESESKGPLPVLVDFWAPWCGPCHMVAPILEELARDYRGRLKIAKVDVDENPVTANRFQTRSIPTLILFVDGEARERIVGAQPRQALEAKLAPYLNPPGP